MSTGTQKILDAAEALGFGAAKLAVPADVADVIAASVAGGEHVSALAAHDEMRSAIGNIKAIGDLLILATAARANFMDGTLSAVADMLTRESAKALECLDVLEGQ